MKWTSEQDQSDNKTRSLRFSHFASNATRSWQRVNGKHFSVGGTGDWLRNRHHSKARRVPAPRQIEHVCHRRGSEQFFTVRHPIQRELARFFFNRFHCEVILHVRAVDAS